MNTTARPRIESGHLIAWSHRPWASWYDLQVQAVRVFTRSEYCHVGIAWRAGACLFALEAVRTGVRIFPLYRLQPYYYLTVPAVWTPEVERWALEQVGEPYSRWQAVKAGLGLLKAGEDNIWQCAEYAQAVLARAGVELKGKATPAHLVDEAMQSLGLPCWPVSESIN
jgi:uncharacterized protein YycO